MSNVRIRPRSATALEWSTTNPILSIREIAYEHPSTGVGTGAVKMKQGDGVTAWNDLPYTITSGGGGGTDTNEVVITENKTKKFYIAGTQFNVTNTGTLTFNNEFYISNIEGLRADKITIVSDIDNGINITNKSGGIGIVCTNELLLVETETNAGFVCNNICNEINTSSIGFHVPVNGGYGFKIDTNNSSGFYIEENNSSGFRINKNNNTAILINENNGNAGIMILKNNVMGIAIIDNISTAIHIPNNSNTGIRIINKNESSSSQGIEFILSMDSSGIGNKAIHITGNSMGYYGGYANRWYYENKPAILIEGGIDNAIEATNSKASFRELYISRYGGDFKNGVVGIKINGGPAGNCIEMSCYGAGSYTDDEGNVVETRNDGIKINAYSSANGIYVYQSGGIDSHSIKIDNSSYSSAILINNYNGKGIEILDGGEYSTGLIIASSVNDYDPNSLLSASIYIESKEYQSKNGITIYHKSAKYGIYLIHDNIGESSDSIGFRLLSTKGKAMVIQITDDSNLYENVGIAMQLRGNEFSRGLAIGNYTAGSGIVIESKGNYGKGIEIKNDSGGIGQLIENIDNENNSISSTIGLSVINNNFGYGIAISNKSNNGIGMTIVNKGTNYALNIDSFNDGIGLFINTSVSQTAIYAKGISELKTIKTDNIIFDNSVSSISKSPLGIDINSSETHTVSFITNCLSPKVDSDIDLGSAELRWNNIYSSSSTISTSDKNKKKNIKVITSKSAKSIINGLNPVTYEYKDGTSGRRHYGLLAQDVEDLITKLGISDKGFGALVKSPKYNEDGTIEGYDYGLRYEEFISILVKELQNQNKELNDLKKEIKSIKEFITL